MIRTRGQVLAVIYLQQHSSGHTHTSRARRRWSPCSSISVGHRHNQIQHRGILARVIRRGIIELVGSPRNNAHKLTKMHLLYHMRIVTALMHNGRTFTYILSRCCNTMQVIALATNSTRKQRGTRTWIRGGLDIK